MTGTFALGLTNVLRPAHEWPAHFYRDDALAHLVSVIADETYDDNYELRELLPSDLPLSSHDGTQTGELLIMMRADNVGGPLGRAKADAEIHRVDAIGRAGVLSLSRPFLRERTVIVPPPCINGPVALPAPHPLAGVFKFSAVGVLAELGILEATADLAELTRFRQLLEVCLEDKLVVSFIR